MILLVVVYALLGGTLVVNGLEEEIRPRANARNNQEILGSGIDGAKYKTACPDYKHYAAAPQ